MTKGTSIFLALCALVIIFIAIGLFSAKTSPTADLPSPTPVVSPTPTAQQKYIDLMTSKCYNTDEVEVPCKG